ncbi:MAG: cation-translocating P-type ATPase [Deltaproteobacteria bacterium]|nr:cation-translocating P-type ATPase [Deltaproteobacteria bacterium]MBI3294975.1 cation-translocating P-type ATPase [Deltaproteobacteria bacterium]
MGSSGPNAWEKDIQEVAIDLATDVNCGLTQVDVAERLLKWGPNVLSEEEGVSGFIRFWRQFKSPVVLILLVATVISGVLAEFTDAIAIFSIVIVNAIVGFLQESKAEAAVRALRKLSAPRARVLREGSTVEVDVSALCPGDVLVFESGDYVPADARIVTASQLSVDESILTGESLPVRKISSPLPRGAQVGERFNMVFAGTLINTGSARALVTDTGMDTEIGHIAELLESQAAEPTPLQLRLEQVGSKLLVLCLGVVTVVSLFGVFHGDGWLSVLMTAVSLAVAAIPEGLPAIVTLALALAIRRMTKRNAIVRHLPAVETLGSTDVICTDKTGTLTTGKMAVREVVFPGRGQFPADSLEDSLISAFSALVESAVLCSNASLTEGDVSTGDPTEVALLKMAQGRGVYPNSITGQFPRVAEWAFDSTRKRMSVAVIAADRIRIHVKGAPEAILPLCKIDSLVRQEMEAAANRLSSEGKRLLAIAVREWPVKPSEFSRDELECTDIENNLALLGLVSLSDPPRLESNAAIAQCKAAGIKVVMITGDHPATAKAIASELGVLEPGQFDGVLTGKEIDSLSKPEFAKQVFRTAVYARVSPEHKLKIVQAWRGQGKIVAMTGDGVNDAPALKAASIGISMGKGGTEVARQASSIILTDDNFATIVAAVEEGRAIYGNIKRTIQYLLSGNLAEILIMFGAAVLGWPTPLAPIHLLWINLVTDGLPSLALAAEPLSKEGLAVSSRPSPGSFFDKRFYTEMSLIGMIIAVLALAVYGYSFHREDEITARTHMFSFLVFAELFRSFASRSETKTWFQMGIRSNIHHFFAVAIPISLQFAMHHVPFFNDLFKVRTLGWKECLIGMGLTLIPVTFIEIRKWTRQTRKPV